MLRYIIFVVLIASLYSKTIIAKSIDLKKCEYKNIQSLTEQIVNFSKTDQITLKLLFQSHKNQEVKVFDSWPELCGSLLFELKIEKTNKSFDKWAECLGQRKELDPVILKSSKKCVRKIFNL